MFLLWYISLTYWARLYKIGRHYHFLTSNARRRYVRTPRVPYYNNFWSTRAGQANHAEWFNYWPNLYLHKHVVSGLIERHARFH